MAQDLASVLLTAPASDPAVSEGNTFDMSATYTQAGHGGEELVDLNWEYATVSGGPYTAIPTVADGSLSIVTNPTVGTDSLVTHSATITADGAGTYYLHVRAVGQTSAASFENGDQVATVTAGALSIGPLTPVDSSNSLDVTEVLVHPLIGPLTPVDSTNSFDVTEVLVSPIIGPLTPVDSANSFDVTDVSPVMPITLGPLTPVDSINSFDIVDVSAAGLVIGPLTAINSINSFDIIDLLVERLIGLTPVDSANSFNITSISHPELISLVPVDSTNDIPMPVIGMPQLINLTAVDSVNSFDLSVIGGIVFRTSSILRGSLQPGSLYPTSTKSVL